VGKTANESPRGKGGDGLSSDISGTVSFYAGGGGSGGQSPPTPIQNSGGQGGGGDGNTGTADNATAGVANTGGGGGGGGHNGGTNYTGKSGGSGIVIISYPNNFKNAASTTGSPTFTNTGGFKIYKFTGSGSITF
jgi:hypothetical protein